MKHLGKRNLLGVLVDALDYESAVGMIVDAASLRRPLAVTALAVHGVMTGVQDRVHRHRLNSLDLVTPDGQPVRWALNMAHRTGLKDRVYGPTLMLQVCQAAASRGLAVYLYGSCQEVVDSLASSLNKRFPDLRIAGAEPSTFGTLTAQDRSELIDRIRRSQANILFVGLGCPRQEVFVYEVREALSLPVVAVGAAFDYHSGFRAEPPLWMQRAGLQWFHRLAQEPSRLWKRYLFLNVAFLVRFSLQLIGLKCPDPADSDHPLRPLFHG
jgi:exopolysaccharide biosynthesis WecB/TagA/CpsF family protein